MIRRLSRKDLDECVSIHMACFPKSFLVLLGRKFLKTYYGGVWESGLAMGLAQQEGDRMLGFVFGFEDPRRCYQYLLKSRGVDFFLSSLAAAVMHPSIIFRLVRALSYPNRCSVDQGLALLSTVAVLPACRRQGVGTRLVQAFWEEALTRVRRGVYLGVKLTETDTIRFYDSLGFREVKDMQNPGHGDSVLMEKKFELERVVSSSVSLPGTNL